MNHLDSKIKRKLMKLIGGPSQDELDVDEILSLMLQISFALMMIFMIAFFLFRAKVGTELEQVHNIQHQQLVSEQRQKLITALEKLADYARTRYGLKVFAIADADLNISYQVKGLVKRGKLTGDRALKNAFINGSATAFKDFSAIDTLRGKRQQQILTSAKIKPAELLKSNRSWLAKEVEVRLSVIMKDCEELQNQVAAEIQDYFIKKPEALKNSEVKKLLQRFTQAAPRERALIIPELSVLLNKHVFEYLRAQTGTPMLEKLK